LIEAIRQTHGHRLSPAISWVRSHAVALAMCATFVVLRVIAIGSTGVWTDPDSISYFDLRVWRPIRLWTVPLVYSIGFSDGQLVVVQTGLSIGAWIAAAVLIARVFQRRAVVNGALAGVLVIGLTAPVTNWDAALLSESLGLSLSVLLIALGLNVLCRPSKSVVWVTSIIAFLWAFSRQSHAYVLVVVVVALALAALLRRPRRRELAVLACVLGVLTVGAITVSNSNTSVQRWNLAEIIGRRVLRMTAGSTGGGGTGCRSRPLQHFNRFCRCPTRQTP